MAQAVGGAAGQGGLMDALQPMLLMAVLVGLFYFLMLRPQQQRAKQHQTAIAALKRGDTVVLSSGMIGKVVRVEENEIGVEIAQGVTVKVVKSMIGEIRGRSAPAAANDSKA
jgi:preprotein translocase subunit YajC